MTLRLHLGCGKRHLPGGWTHVDVADYPHVDVRHDVSQLHLLYAGVVHEMYASHVLEHFGRHQVQSVLNAWSECMVPGGKIWIAAPDFEAVAAQYAATRNLGELTGLLYGGQRDEFDYHKTTFDFDTLKRALEAAGFCNVERYDHAQFLPVGFDDWSRSYLPHMDCEHGRLMSLNVTAQRAS